jgi:hypothetical protein
MNAGKIFLEVVEENNNTVYRDDLGLQQFIDPAYGT